MIPVYYTEGEAKDHRFDIFKLILLHGNYFSFIQFY